MSVHYWRIPCDGFKWNTLSLDPLKSAMRVAVLMTESCCIVVYGSAFCVHTSQLASSVKIKGPFVHLMKLAGVCLKVKLNAAQ